MKITKKEEYEANAILYKGVSDETLKDLYLSVRDIYDSISAEVANRIMKPYQDKLLNPKKVE